MTINHGGPKKKGIDLYQTSFTIPVEVALLTLNPRLLNTILNQDKEYTMVDTVTAPAAAVKTRKPRKTPQPKNYNAYVILFSDGTYVHAEPSELIGKMTAAAKLAKEAPPAENLTFEVRGVSRKVTSVRQKSTGAAKFDLSGDSVKVESGKAKNGGLDIDFADK
jgi:hypothetical protein